MSHTLEPTEPRQISISDYEVNPCGCKVSFGHDPHPAVPWMHYCKLHAAAPAMREALKRIAKESHTMSCPTNALCYICEALAQAEERTMPVVAKSFQHNESTCPMCKDAKRLEGVTAFHTGGSR